MKIFINIYLIIFIDNMHFLITYVGYTIDATWKAYEEIRSSVMPIDRVYILCSTYPNKEGKYSYELANEAAKLIYRTQDPSDRNHVTDISRVYSLDQNYGGRVFTVVLDEKQNMDYEYVRDYIVRLYTDNDKPRITMNITNGNGITKCAMCIAASEVGGSIYYVDFNPQTEESSVQKVTDCRAANLDILGKTEKKVLWAIKEMEDEHNSQSDVCTLRGLKPKENSVDFFDDKKESRGGPRNCDITRAAISKYTERKWPSAISPQSITGAVDGLEEKGMIRVEPINKKEYRILLTSTGRIALSHIPGRP